MTTANPLPDLKQLRDLASTIAALREQAERLSDDLEGRLAPAIRHWQAVERPSCGRTGGWKLDEVRGDTVHLKHECFTAHQYDLDHRCSTAVDLSDLLQALPT